LEITLVVVVSKILPEGKRKTEARTEAVWRHLPPLPPGSSTFIETRRMEEKHALEIFMNGVMSGCQERWHWTQYDIREIKATEIIRCFYLWIAHCKKQ
jgi:hypothetical protein